MNNKIILIESQPSMIVRYYPGSLTIKNIEYFFEVREAENYIEVVWADFTIPDNYEELESEIIEIFTKGR